MDGKMKGRLVNFTTDEFEQAVQNQQIAREHLIGRTVTGIHFGELAGEGAAIRMEFDDGAVFTVYQEHEEDTYCELDQPVVEKPKHCAGGCICPPGEGCHQHDGTCY